jgi:hypothetical protein
MQYTIDEIKSVKFAEKIHNIMELAGMQWAFQREPNCIITRLPTIEEIREHVVNMIKRIKAHPNFDKVRTAVQRYHLGGFQISHKKYAKEGHVWNIHFSPVNIHISEK